MISSFFKGFYFLKEIASKNHIHNFKVDLELYYTINKLLSIEFLLETFSNHVLLA